MLSHCLKLSRGIKLSRPPNVITTLETIIDSSHTNCHRPISLHFKTLSRNYSSTKMTEPYLPKVVFVLGAPGSGKGTQCENIVKQYGYIHLSAGALLRQERNRSGSEYGEFIEKCIQEGRIVPVEITCGLLENAMAHHIRRETVTNFLIDGFPRNQDNVDGWTKRLSTKTRLQFVLFFECSEQICTERCLNRGLEGSGRSDDNIDSLKKRFKTYISDTMPIVDYYQKMNMVKVVDGSTSPDKVFSDVKSLFHSL